MNDPLLQPDVLLTAYRMGVFPMGDRATGEVNFFACEPRAILPLETFRAPRGARRKLARGIFTVTFDRDFERVMRACAIDRSAENPSWIIEPMIAAYARLHALGRAHSAETWRDGRLVGGIYGVSLGAAFFGESMFSRVDEGGEDASSAALAMLVERLRARGFTLFDCQYANDHTTRLGVVEIEHDDYLQRLQLAIDQPDRW